MSKSLNTLQVEFLRLGVLQTLEKSQGYVSNLDILCDRHVVGMMEMVECVKWLGDNGLVTWDQLDGVTTARLTRTGQDVANGRTMMTGVRRPGP